MNNKYLIICLRYGYFNRDNLVFWGKNRSGYYSDLSKVGVYTKEEALRICNRSEDFYISLDKLGITQEMLDFNHPYVEMKFKRTEKICDYINEYLNLYRNKQLMIYGEV
ncbi:hypothetical protein KQI18_11565 [Clostridioides mangenotii]|uniref:hypothetical protein n=1 Tax=Metaclostridioides mangenotii TaxID=1540 RepID=UPI001C0FB037|nr:hypothetical protein [Clostridioides mangenotii]MBU5308414.1 hypothetical protein [Clostridioides mangenotii]